ncbi:MULTISPECIES: DUF1876 domain-containing protein [Streptomycetaceae]|nr:MULTISPECIES: DUF1876 domain-containing protein [Streptomycetaceae]MYS57389.1 DUF1876 domain-containing protein [Streptomyces sp. SID5468]CCB72963.1 conserved protein of unknown function [Streptantibioticus cattleyicolor NRRL 8057 = DSM 46488]
MKALLEWHIDLGFQEIGHRDTRTAVSLRLPDNTELHAEGHARKHPDDPRQTQVGEELAAARALNELARQLLAKAADDIEHATHIPAHPTM